jgi:hypothetical protein
MRISIKKRDGWTRADTGTFYIKSIRWHLAELIFRLNKPCSRRRVFVSTPPVAEATVPSVTTTNEEGNGNANAALVCEFFERGIPKLEALAKTDPEKARALTQAWIERIREIVD